MCGAETCRGEEHEHLEAVMAFYERRSSLKIIRHWRGRRARLRKAQADEQRRERAAAKEKARQEAVLHVNVEDEHPSDSAAVSPVPNKQRVEELSLIHI